MYINTHAIQDSDILVVFDYPSISEFENGHIADGNAKSYVYKHLRELGINCSRVSWHSVLSYPLGNSKITDFYRTTKAKIHREDTVHAGGFFFEPSLEKPFADLFDTIRFTNPKVIICMSVLALSAFGFGTSIEAWRGSQLKWSTFNMLVTYSPLALYKSPERHMPFKRDLARLRDLSNWDMPKFNIQFEYGFDELIEQLDWHIDSLATGCKPYAVDLETRNPLPTFIGFAWDKRNALVIPFIKPDGTSYWSVDQEFAIVKKLKTFLTHPNIQIIGQNFQYDIQYVTTRWGFLPKIYRDTMVEAHVLFTKGLSLDLAFLSSLYCSWYRYWKQDGKDFHKSFKSADDFKTYALYNGYDNCYTFEVYEELDKVHKRMGETLPVSFQREMQNIILKPVIAGIRFDKALQQRWRREYEVKIADYKAWLLYMIPQEKVNATGNSFWFDSPTQMSFLFYKQLGIEPVLDKKTKRPTTNDDALINIGKREPILRLVCDVLRTYRSVMQFYNLYLAAHVSPDGRARTTYMLPGTDTFRLASKQDAFDQGFNLQNLSKG